MSGTQKEILHCVYCSYHSTFFELANTAIKSSKKETVNEIIAQAVFWNTNSCFFPLIKKIYFYSFDKALPSDESR